MNFNRFLKVTAKYLLFLGAFYGVQQLCHLATGGFEVNKITSSLSYNPKWNVTPLDDSEKKTIKTALNQKFHYLGSGLQCYVFESEDKNYVIKVFKHHHMRPVSYVNRLVLPKILKPMQQNLIHEREKRLRRHFSSYKIAYEDLKEQTGVLYSHLNKNKEFDQTIVLVDHLGIEHLIDLDTTEFVLQKKAELIRPVLERHISSARFDLAEECLDSLIQAILFREKKGIANRDPNIWTNFGFIDNQAVEIDVGSFVKDPFQRKGLFYKNELFHETLPLRRWLKKQSAELYAYFDRQMIIALSNE